MSRILILALVFFLSDCTSQTVSCVDIETGEAFACTLTVEIIPND